MKKCKLITLTLMIILIFSGCSGVQMLSDKDADIYAKIHRRYSEMKSYTATAEVTVKSNKTENKYTVSQKYLAPDKMSANISETGVSFIISEDGVRLKNGESTLDFLAADAVNYLFINEFFKIYYMSQDTALTVSSDSVSSVTRLETELIPASAKRHSAVLTINNKTLAPERLTVSDMGGNAVITVDFKSFIYNDKIDEGIFTY